jgi:hypothetical protein
MYDCIARVKDKKMFQRSLFIFSLKLPEEEENKDETEVLLNEPSSPSFKLKQPQPQISLPESVVPKISTKLENSE